MVHGSSLGHRESERVQAALVFLVRMRLGPVRGLEARIRLQGQRGREWILKSGKRQLYS